MDGGSVRQMSMQIIYTPTYFIGTFLFGLPEKSTIHVIYGTSKKTAYGIVESGRLWYLTAFRALESFDLRPCPYDKTLFKLENASLLVTKQVDNFIFTGTSESMEGFATYMAQCFRLSELEYDNFTVYGTRFSRDSRGVHIERITKNTGID
jgi:hypothetical protein